MASSVGGILSHVNDRETGLLVPSKDSSALAEKVLFLLENEEAAKKLGRAGRESVLKDCPLLRTIDRIEDLYKKAVEGYS